MWFTGPGRVAIDDGDGWATTVACTPTKDGLILHPDRLEADDFEPEEDGVSMYDRLVEGVGRLRPHMRLEQSPGPSDLATLTVGGAARRGRPGVLWVAGEGRALADALAAADPDRPVILLDGRKARTGHRFFQQLLDAAGLPDTIRPDWEALVTLPHYLADRSVLIIDNATALLLDAPTPTWEQFLGLCDATVAEPGRHLTVALCDPDPDALNKRRWVWHPATGGGTDDQPAARHPTGPTVTQAADGTWRYREMGRP